MTNSVNYKYTPNQSVYVIDTLGNGSQGQYPYWGYPYGYGYAGFPYDWANGSQPAYPNGFTSTTPAIQSGTVLQVRILFTTSNPSVPTIMYDVRINGEMGTTPFPESMVFPATAGVAGSQTVNYGGSLTYNTAITVSVGLSDLIYVDGAPLPSAITSPVPTSVAALLAALNNQYAEEAVFTLVNGNIVVSSATAGVASSIVVVKGTTSLFAALPGFVGFNTAVPGVASGLDQAQAYYGTLQL